MTEQVPSTATEQNPTAIVIGETVPAVEGVKHNTTPDPHLELKKLLKEQYPTLDAFQFDVAIQIHEQLVKLHGADYNEEQYVAYVKERSSPLCERDESLSKE